MFLHFCLCCFMLFVIGGIGCLLVYVLFGLVLWMKWIQRKSNKLENQNHEMVIQKWFTLTNSEFHNLCLLLTEQFQSLLPISAISSWQCPFVVSNITMLNHIYLYSLSHLFCCFEFLQLAQWKQSNYKNEVVLDIYMWSTNWLINYSFICQGNALPTEKVCNKTGL